jgi:carbonic anhydrase
MNRPKRMLLENIAWAEESAHTDPSFFDGLVRGQSPKVLWLGCSDSRVPAETVTNCNAGDLFVHRNIANLFSANDDNVMSVLEYAVHVLKVEDVIVCGHHGCGGVKASMFPVSDSLPHVRRRIAPVCELARRHHSELDACAPGDERINRLAELNVLEQVRALRSTAIIRNAPHAPSVHGWIFGLHDGRIEVLSTEDKVRTIEAGNRRTQSNAEYLQRVEMAGR